MQLAYCHSLQTQLGTLIDLSPRRSINRVEVDEPYAEKFISTRVLAPDFDGHSVVSGREGEFLGGVWSITSMCRESGSLGGRPDLCDDVGVLGEAVCTSWKNQLY